MKFTKPKHIKNLEGSERRVGLEIEYANLGLDDSAQIVEDLYGGKKDCLNDAVCQIKDTRLGDFEIELDAALLKRLSKEAREIQEQQESQPDNWDAIDKLRIEISKKLNETGSKVAPFEIVAPPVPFSKLKDFEELRIALSKKGAEDTRKAFYYAFGFQINPEVASLEADYITRHIQSFLLLAPWLAKEHDVDMTRRVSSFADPFPKSYLKLVLNVSYKPSIEELIRDYHKHNPTRNRALDMLPLFAHIDEKLVRDLYGEKEKINKRPTFHYRLPNCELSNPDWSFALEWNRWIKIEELAEDKDQLIKLMEEWQEYYKKWLTSESDWINIIDNIMESKNA